MSKLIGKFFFKNEIENRINFTHDKYFIRKLMKNNTLVLKKHKLILCCILSSLVYRYKEIKTENNIDTNKIDIKCNESNEQKYNELISEEAVKEFNELCYSWDLNNDNTSIYNIDNILVFGVFYINNNLFISFKGSSNLNDFIADLDIKQVDFKYNENESDHEIKIKIPGKVHKGGYEILFENDRYKFIMNKIKEYKGENIYITGHSLGGLLATIFYSFLKEYYYSNVNSKINIKLITFGCPRVGNKTFCNSIDYNNNNRVMNNNDIITKLPLPIGYSHTDLLFHIGKNPIKNFWFNIKDSIEDHKIENYYKNLFLLD